jgi:23S rRNA (uracil1939-C5)-methyltransferase
MTVGETLTCTVTTLAYGGDGVARVDGRVLFIPDTAPGDTVMVRIRQIKKNFARATALQLLKASASRAEPCCRLGEKLSGALIRAPGCVYDHLSYLAELHVKTEQLTGFLNRFSEPTPIPLLPSVGAPATLHYRNKIVLHADRTRDGVLLGYRQEPSHRVLDIACCPLACESINSALSAFRLSPQFQSLPQDADVTFRHTAHDGTCYWVNRETPVGNSPDLLTEQSPAGPLLVPREGFYQVNPLVGDLLVRTVAAWFAERPTCSQLIDLYCGVGVFGLACLVRGGSSRLIGIESGREAVAAARLNAASLGVDATFLCHALGHSPLSLNSLIDAPQQATAIVDPPREGMTIDMTSALATSGVARIFYVSCDPATLTRDLTRLCAGGRYRLTRAQLFDMFPRTAHFETVVELRLAE